MDIKTQIKDKENVFFDMEAYLPKKNGSVFFHVATHTVNFICQMHSCVCLALFCSQTVPEFGPGQCERNASQQPGKVC